MKVTMQELALPLLGARVQGLGVMLELEPAGPPVVVKPTLPSGELFVPLATSVTVTVHIAGLLAGVDAGQSTVVVVVRAMTCTVSEPLLAAWIDPAAGVYVPVMV